MNNFMYRLVDNNNNNNNTHVCIDVSAYRVQSLPVVLHQSPLCLGRSLVIHSVISLHSSLASVPWIAVPRGQRMS